MRALVVEDDEAMASSLTWGLEAEGYVVDMADNGEDGLWKASESSHDVIILDVMLPGLDGYQVCQRLREEGVWTPILMLTAMDEDLDHAEGLDIGADDYLTKPFSYPIPAVLSAAGLTLDPASRTVMRDGTPLELTHREVAVLEYLMRRQGRAVSKSELLEHCWDAAYDGGPAVVEVLIHRLRRKIDPASAAPAIVTLRGEGYMIEQGGP